MTSLVVTIGGPIGRAEVPRLCAHVRAQLEARARTVECDVRGAAADAVTVEALARLQLTARRCGSTVQLRGTSTELHALIEFMGLDAALVA